MVFLETVCLFAGGDYGIFYGAAYDGGCTGSAFLRPGFRHDRCDDCENTDLRRSYFGLAVIGVHYSSGQRCTAVLPRHSRAILIQDVYGSEEKADLSC